MTTTTLITGATSGIGKEIALLEASNGRNLILTGRRTDRLEELAHHCSSQFGVKVACFSVDLGKAGSAEELYAYCRGVAHVDTLVNNAGFGEGEYFENTSSEKIEEMVAVNITSLTTLCRLFGEDMLRRGQGEILNIASLTSFLPLPYMSVYSATKGYVLSLSLALRQEWKSRGIAISCCCPGTTATEFFDVAGVKRSLSLPMQSAKAVAKVAIKGVRGNKAVTVPGLHNKFSRLIAWLLPASWLLPVSAAIFRPTHQPETYKKQ